MKISKLILGLLLTLSFNSWAGDVGNGGFAVVCREPSVGNTKGKIIKAELLDLFELRERYHHTLIESQKPALEQLTVLLDKKKHLFDDDAEIDSKINHVIAKLHILRDGIGIKPIPDDSFPTLYEKGCDFEQVANYIEPVNPNESVIIDIDFEIYKALSETSKAALYLHEAIYALARSRIKSKDSINTRKLVAYLFSKEIASDSVELKNIVKVTIGTKITKIKCRFGHNRIDTTIKEFINENYGFQGPYCFYSVNGLSRVCYIGDSIVTQRYYGEKSWLNESHVGVFTMPKYMVYFINQDGMADGYVSISCTELKSVYRN